MAVPKIYRHPLDEYHHVVEAMQSHLPTCIPLYRRFQFRHYTSTSYILSSLDPQTLNKGSDAHTPWIAAYVDRSRRPETEVWVFGTWESGPSIPDHEAPIARDLIRALVAEIREIGLEGVVEAAPSQAAVVVVANGQSKNSAIGVGRAEYENYLADSNVVLFGALHGHTAGLVKEMGLLSPGFVGADIPYRKYIFDVRYV